MKKNTNKKFLVFQFYEQIVIVKALVALNYIVIVLKIKENVMNFVIAKDVLIEQKILIQTHPILNNSQFFKKLIKAQKFLVGVKTQNV